MQMFDYIRVCMNSVTRIFIADTNEIKTDQRKCKHGPFIIILNECNLLLLINLHVYSDAELPTIITVTLQLKIFR